LTPAARVSAAIDVLDRTLAGTPVEKALTNWARGARFAGSKDRAAIRDHVFDALRCRASFAAMGGGLTGRGLMLGMVRATGGDLAEIFDGTGYGPDALTDAESSFSPPQLPRDVALDCPDWLLPLFDAALGKNSDDVLMALKSRAPLFLRVNTTKATREDASEILRSEEIETSPHPLSLTALKVLTNPRRVAASRAFVDGLVEIQDAASQFVADQIPVSFGTRVLDYCAGGGGKSLALAARGANVSAHDAEPRRMKDIPARAIRAGATIEVLDTQDLARHAPFDVVFCDAPCSGSGAWRRSPEAKWLFTQEKLTQITQVQLDILDAASKITESKGVLAYATCSMLRCENQDQISAFMERHSGWALAHEHMLTPLDGGDGFYVALLTRE